MVLLGVASLQGVPGYMDAEYYFSGGLQLYRGEGFSEPYLWNFLADPDGLPAPSHAYWMPLASILAFLGMKAGGSGAFWPARLGFLALAILVPVLTVKLYLRLGGDLQRAWFPGLLAVFSGFYLVFLPSTDTFGLYMVLGSTFLLVASTGGREFRIVKRDVWPVAQPVILGGLAGGMHLSRADGILWVVVALGWVLLSHRHIANGDGHLAHRRLSFQWKKAIQQIVLVLAGYLLIMLSWFLRNLSVFGTFLAPGGTRTLWLTDYNELYAYPAAQLTPDRWWASGIEAILGVRWEALGLNVQTAIAVQGMVFLAPFVLAGLWKLRRKRAVQLAVTAWLFTFLAMTLVFPFAGSRGGFFHSGAAVQPLFWAAAPFGLDAFIEWGRRSRGWQPSTAGQVFRAGFLAIAIALSAILTWNRLAGDGSQPAAWNQGADHYRQIDDALTKIIAGDGGAQEAILVNNPPGFFVATGRSGVTIPFGDADTVLAVAGRYDLRYLVLEIDQVRDAADLYTAPADRQGFDYLITVDGAHIYRLAPADR